MINSIVCLVRNIIRRFRWNEPFGGRARGCGRRCARGGDEKVWKISEQIESLALLWISSPCDRTHTSHPPWKQCCKTFHCLKQRKLTCGEARSSSRRRWTTRSAQMSNKYWNFAMHVQHNFLMFDINTTTYHLGRYSPYLLLLKISIGENILLSSLN